MTARAYRWLLVSSLAVVPGCGDGGPGGSGPPPPSPLAIISRTPAPDATSVETGAAVDVVFNQAIDPATLTMSSFRILLRGVPLPGSLTYDPASRTARVTGPLLPDSTYEAEVTMGVRTPNGGTLSAPSRWSFTLRKWEGVTIATEGAVGWYSSIAVAQDGRVHITYRHHYDAFDLKYATCATNCTSASQWQTAAIDTLNAVGEHSSLALDGTGRLHVSYTHDGNSDLKYATCATNCWVIDNWQTATLDGALEVVGYYTSLVIAGNRLHVSYSDETNQRLKYATCAASCTVPASWTLAPVDESGYVFFDTSIDVDAATRLHIAYYDFNQRDLKYATCATNCAAAASWQHVTVDAADWVGADASLDVDDAGRWSGTTTRTTAT